MTPVHRLNSDCNIEKSNKDNIQGTGSVYNDFDNDTAVIHAIGDQSSSSVCYGMLNFYEQFNDCSLQLFNTQPRLPMPFTDLPRSVQQCVRYASDVSFTENESKQYYYHIDERDRFTSVKGSNSISHYFLTYKNFHENWMEYYKLKGIADGWLRAYIKLPVCVENTTGCYRCPLNPINKLFTIAGGLNYIISFRCTTN